MLQPPLKLEMFSCRGWQKCMSGNCSFVFSMHNNWWMKTIKSIMQWPGYNSFFVGAVLPIFVSIPCLFHYFCCVQHIRNSYIHWYNDPVELRLHGTRKDYKKRGINRKCKSNNLDKIRINNKNGCDTFNRFHSPVIVHRKHEGAVTRHEFLPSSARKHLQL
jgi:hypothetical protein